MKACTLNSLLSHSLPRLAFFLRLTQILPIYLWYFIGGLFPHKPSPSSGLWAQPRSMALPVVSTVLIYTLIYDN